MIVLAYALHKHSDGIIRVGDDSEKPDDNHINYRCCSSRLRVSLNDWQ